MNDLIHLRLGTTLKKELEIVKDSGYYTTVTDFIKEAIRAHLFTLRKQQAYEQLAKMRGADKPNNAKRSAITKEKQSQILREYAELFREVR